MFSLSSDQWPILHVRVRDGASLSHLTTKARDGDSYIDSVTW